MAGSTISTPEAPRPAAAYAQGARRGNLLQVAGQVPFDPATGEVVGTDVATQARQALRNVEAVLAAAGAGFADVLMVRVYLTDTAHFAAFNEVYNGRMAELGEPYPARTTVYVGLPGTILVEIDALAVLED